MQAYTICLVTISQQYIDLGQAVLTSRFWKHTTWETGKLLQHMVATGNQMVKFEMSPRVTRYKPDAYAFMPV